jgi:hypothetical protein
MLYAVRNIENETQSDETALNGVLSADDFTEPQQLLQTDKHTIGFIQ